MPPPSPPYPWAAPRRSTLNRINRNLTQRCSLKKHIARFMIKSLKNTCKNVNLMKNYKLTVPMILWYYRNIILWLHRDCFWEMPQSIWKKATFFFSCDTFYTAFMQFELSWNENITSNYMGFRITGYLGFLILFFMKWQLW